MAETTEFLGLWFRGLAGCGQGGLLVMVYPNARKVNYFLPQIF